MAEAVNAPLPAVDGSLRRNISGNDALDRTSPFPFPLAGSHSVQPGQETPDGVSATRKLPSCFQSAA